MPPKDGRTPLHAASRNGHTGVCRLLISKVVCHLVIENNMVTLRLRVSEGACLEAANKVSGAAGAVQSALRLGASPSP